MHERPTGGAGLREVASAAFDLPSGRSRLPPAPYCVQVGVNSGAAEQRNWAAAGRNVAALAAAGVGAAAHAPVFPVFVAFDLLTALMRRPKDPDGAAFLERFLDRIDRWCRDEGAFATLGDEPSSWRDRLRARLISQPVDTTDDLTSIFVDTVFEPVSQHGHATSEALAQKLAAVVPTLIVEAGDPFGVGAAAVALVNGAVGAIERAVSELDDALRPVGDAALIAVYLSKLIAWLDRNDLCPTRLGAPRTLTAIQQKLAIRRLGQRFDCAPVAVDDLAEGCERLVLLGGPGSGKSWTARRLTIRAASTALERLAAGDRLDEIELPLFATCSDVLQSSNTLRWDRLINATMRRSAIDPGHAQRLRQILRNHEHELVVLDGLDEAAAPERSAVHELVDARPPGSLRVVLTSRLGSWDERLLELADGNEAHQIGTLEPFTPDDTVATVVAWLDDLPATRDRLIALVGNPTTALARQARVPLLCSMFCLAARPDPDKPDEDPFDYFAPGRRLELFDVVVRKLLAGSWRDTATAKPSVGQLKSASRWLEDLAEAGDLPDPADTGLSRWPDPITSHSDPPAGTREYVDNVVPPDPHEDILDHARRFVHRNLREHLAARALRRQPAEDLAPALFQRLWFDSNWAEVIPSVIAGHPDADNLVETLVRLVNAAIPFDPLNALDNALLRAAARTAPRPGPAAARDTAIERAIQAALDRTPTDQWHEFEDVAHWSPIGIARSLLLRMLEAQGTDEEDLDHHTWVLSVLVRDDPQIPELAQHALRSMEDPGCDPTVAARLAKAIAAIAPDTSFTDQSARRILELVTAPELDTGDAIHLCEALAASAPTSLIAERGAESFLSLAASGNLDIRDTIELVAAVVDLVPQSPQALRGVEILLGFLVEPHDLGHTLVVVGELVRLAPGCPKSQELGALVIDYVVDPNLHIMAIDRIKTWVSALAARTLDLEALLDEAVDRLEDPSLSPAIAARLAKAIAASGPSDRHAVRGAKRVLKLMDRSALDLTDAIDLGVGLAALVPGTSYAQRGAEILLRILGGAPLGGLQEEFYRLGLAQVVADLAHGCPEPERLAYQILERIDDLSLEQRIGYRLGDALAVLGSGYPQRNQLADRLLETMSNPNHTAKLAGALVALAPGSPQAERGAELVFQRIAGPGVDASDALWLTEVVIALAPGSIQAGRAIEVLFELLANPDLDKGNANRLIDALVSLVPGRTNANQVAGRAIEFLSSGDLQPESAIRFAELLATLSPGSEQAKRGAESLLELLAARGVAPWSSVGLARVVSLLAPRIREPQRMVGLVIDRLKSLPDLEGVHLDPLGDGGAGQHVGSWLVHALASLASGCPRSERLGNQILDLLEDTQFARINCGKLAQALAAVAANGTQAQRGGERLLGLLTAPDVDTEDTIDLMVALSGLSPTALQAERGAKILLGILAEASVDTRNAARAADALGEFRKCLSIGSWIAAFPGNGRTVTSAAVGLR